MARGRSTESIIGDAENLFSASVIALARQFAPANRTKRDNTVGNRTVDRISLGSFVEATSNMMLDPWQWHLCDRLQMLTYQRGQHIMIHKPPQLGGSVIVSQRLPSYLIGDDPETRVKLSCYNEEQSKRFGRINQAILKSPEFKAMFPGEALDVLGIQPADEWFTEARRAMRDAQASFRALGIKTGFVGQGADHLMIDDPYASPLEAESKAVRKSTWDFWESSAKPRIDDNTNVVMMFHRYNEDDIAGQMIKEEGLIQEGGKWELIFYRGEWDGDERIKSGGPDPLNRNIGEFLTSRKSYSFWMSKKANSNVWLSQFQGKPSREDGGFFKVSNFNIIPKCPVKLVKVCRAWDIASDPDGDWTVGVLMGLGEDEHIYVLDVKRFRETTDKRDSIIKNTARTDFMRYGDLLIIRMPQDPAAAGKDQALAFTKLLKGYDIKTMPIGGNKQVRADPWSRYVNAGLAHLVYSPSSIDPESEGWTKDYIEEHRKFLKTTTDDQIDASSDCFAELTLELDIEPGYSFNTMGLVGETFEGDVRVVTDFTEQELISMMAESIIDFGVDSRHMGAVVNGNTYVIDKPDEVPGDTRRSNRYDKEYATKQSKSSNESPEAGAVSIAERRTRFKSSNQHRPTRINNVLQRY